MAGARKKQVNGMTGMQNLFVEEYLRCWSARLAAKKAGYANPDNDGWRILRLPYVQAVINERVKAMQMETDEVMVRLTQQARTDIGVFFKKFGKGVVIDWDKVIEFGYLVKKVTYNAKNKPMLEFHDPQRALELIAKAKGVFVDRSEVKVGDLNPVQVYIPDNGRAGIEPPKDTEPEKEDLEIDDETD